MQPVISGCGFYEKKSVCACVCLCWGARVGTIYQTCLIMSICFQNHLEVERSGTFHFKPYLCAIEPQDVISSVTSALLSCSLEEQFLKLKPNIQAAQELVTKSVRDA